MTCRYGYGYIEAPNYLEEDANTEGYRTCFLAGGITNCRDWQSEFVNMKSDSMIDNAILSVIYFNPRRANFDINDPSVTEEQIKWEKYHLDIADLVVFWFSPETLNPITLFELGKELTKPNRNPKNVFIGVDPNYARANDIKVQAKLINPEYKIHTSLDSLHNAMTNTDGIFWTMTFKYEQGKGV